MNEPAKWGKWQGVVDRISDSRCALIDGLETMLMMPNPKGAANLTIDEASPFLPDRNLGKPRKRYAEEAQTIFDKRPRSHFDRHRSDDTELKFWWCDRLKVRCVSEELENLIEWPEEC